MRRNIRLLYAHSFLTYFCPYWPYQVIFFQQITGSYTAAMTAIAFETIGTLLFDIPTGVMSDKLGRRITIALGSLAGAIGLGLYAGAHGIVMLCAGGLLNGLSQCLFNGNNNALMYETLQTEGQQSRYAHYRATRGIMLQLGLCLSGFAATPLSLISMRAVFIASTIPQILAIPVSLMFVDPRVASSQKQKSLALFAEACVMLWRNPRLIWLVLSGAISYGTGEAAFKLQGAFIGMVWPVWAVGLYRGLHHSCSIIGYVISQRIIGRVKPFHIFVFHDVYMFTLRMVALILHNTVSPLLTAASTIMFAPGQVANEALQQMEFTDDQRATMGSLSSTAASILFALAAIGIGAITDAYGIIAGMVFGTVLAALCLPINVHLFRREA